MIRPSRDVAATSPKPMVVTMAKQYHRASLKVGVLGSVNLRIYAKDIISSQEGHEQGKVQGVPVGIQKRIVIRLGISVSAIAPFAGLDEQGHQHEHDKGDGRLHGQQRKRPDRQPDPAGGARGPEQYAGELVAHGQDREQPERDQPFPDKDPPGTVVQEEHEQRAQEQVDEQVEGREAKSVRVMEHLHHQGHDLVGFGADQLERPDEEMVEGQVEHREHAEHGHAVAQQLLPVALGIAQYPGEVGDQQQGQRQVGKRLHEIARPAQPALQVGIDPDAQVDHHRGGRRHDAKPAQDLE